jgi:hypothetical protein
MSHKEIHDLLLRPCTSFGTVPLKEEMKVLIKILAKNLLLLSFLTCTLKSGVIDD